MTDATPLPREARLRARQMAEAHASDSHILGALRADVYDSTEPGSTRDLMLATLEVMHPDDHRELRAYRDRGMARLHLVMYACAMSYAINERKERYDGELHASEDGFAEVDAKAASMAQFLGRVFLAVDPESLHEEARAAAQRLSEMSSDEQLVTWLQVGRRLGLSDEMAAEVGRSVGLRVVDGAKTA